MKSRKALLVVDVQNDFCPGGALGIPGCHSIVPKVNRYIRIFTRRKLPVFFTRDWHPVKTSHFRDFGGAWPVHCVQNTYGAQFHPQLKVPPEAILLYKGIDPHKDSYSAFQAEDASGTFFPQLLKIMGITELYIAGLATDYCVKFSTRDAVKKGLKVRILIDAIRGVDLKPDDSLKAIKEMVKSGAKKMTLKNFKEKT